MDFTGAKGDNKNSWYRMREGRLAEGGDTFLKLIQTTEWITTTLSYFFKKHDGTSGNSRCDRLVDTEFIWTC